MTEAEFKTQMQRVDNEWPKGLGVEKVKLIWAEWRTLPAKSFERVITKILTTHRQVPLVADFVDHAKGLKIAAQGLPPEIKALDHWPEADHGKVKELMDSFRKNKMPEVS